MSVELTTKDYEQLQLKANKILQDLESVDKTEWKKKKDLIEEYVVTNRTLLKANKLPINHPKDFCSYIVLQLNNRGVTVNQNGVFYALFTDEEKDPRGPKPIDQKSIEISSAFRTAQEDIKTTKETINDAVTEYLEFEKTTLEQCIMILDDVLAKYPEFQAEIKKGLGDITTNMEEAKELRAIMEDCAKHLDLRNKALEFKKIKALLLEKVEYNIAKVANLIHISPKHMSANIMKNEQDDLMQKAKWFDVVDVKCSCGKDNVLDIANWFDRQVERMTLSLPFKKPQITHVVK